MDINNKYKAKAILDKIDKNWLDNCLLPRNPNLPLFSCERCGHEIGHEIANVPKYCPRCNHEIKNKVTCLICGYVGKIPEFLGKICPSCGAINGMPRTVDEAQESAKRLAHLLKRTGKIQVNYIDGSLIFEISVKDGNYEAKLA